MLQVTLLLRSLALPLPLLLLLLPSLPVALSQPQLPRPSLLPGEAAHFLRARAFAYDIACKCSCVDRVLTPEAHLAQNQRDLHREPAQELRDLH